ncbi:ABC transporter permease [Brevibacterium samyangense]|uniref:FtsX-like permease family protein n=1 Tax=Brevibacterium samyangense TaxID=366888 RepID=A0ABP5EPX5_9MICO
MLRVALSGIRAHWSRYIAICLAVALAAGFVSATLLVNAAMNDTLTRSIGAQYAHSDLAVVPTGGTPDTETLRRVADATADVDGVARAEPDLSAWVIANSGRAADSAIELSPVSEGSPLGAPDVAYGRLPSGADEVVLSEDSATRFHLGLGDRLSVDAPFTDEQVAEESLPPEPESVDLEIVGLAATTSDPAAAGRDLGWVSAERFTDTFVPGASGDSVLVTADDGTEAADLLTAVASAVDEVTEGSAVENPVTGDTESVEETAPVTFDVLTRQDAVNERVSSLSGGNDVLTWLLLGFALVSVFVAGLVVANTFAVVVAQRRRELALLRCIGAAPSQVFRSVLAEGFVVGVVGGVLGVLGAWGLLTVLVTLGSYTGLDVPASAVVPTPAAIGAGLAAGIVLTVLASVAPARSATRVTPLEALRPAEEVTVSTRAGRVRGVLGVVVLALGVGLLVTALVLVSGDAVWILVGMLGGCLVFVGLVMSAVLFVPALVGGIGRLTVARTGIAGRLATLNAVRNRSRTAATATALVVGVGLVTTILMGGQTVKATANEALAQKYPVDLLVTVSEPVQDAALRDLAGITGVTAVAPGLDVPADDGSGEPRRVLGLDTAAAGEVLLPQAPALVDGHVSVPAGSAVTHLRLGDASDGPEVPVTAAGNSSDVYLAPRALLEDEVADEARDAVVLRVAPDAGPDALSDIRFDAAEVLDVSPSEVSGTALARAAYTQVIDILMLIAVGLLAIAVVIALIGVSNTMSLSVIERTRENALLRALGLGTGRLRGMLATEAVLISVVAALIGTAVGSALGAIGARLVTSELSDRLVPGVPWWAYLAILAVAVLAGLLSSLLPARRATRLSPVEGLTTVE